MRIKQRLLAQYQRYLRVWRLLKKPTMEEYRMISKVTAIGLLVLGALGFAIAAMVEFLI
jgi:protein translocase SEC61 complex gamma subunit